MKRQILFYVFAFLMLGLGVGIAIILVDYNKPSEEESLPVINNTAPDFRLKTIQGKYVQLSQLQGSAVLINFWATWCQPCRLEMPSIQDQYVQYQPELLVLAVNLSEPFEVVNEFVNNLNLSFDVLLDPDGSIPDLYNVRGYPTSFFIDAKGIIRIIHIGYMTESQLENYLSQVGVSE
jgi:peroxiredoxin